MTPEELEKEAERLLQDYELQWDKKSVTIRLVNALRAVHNAAIEKALKIAEAALVERGNQTLGMPDRWIDGAFAEAKLIRDEIRALKIGGSK